MKIYCLKTEIQQVQVWIEMWVETKTSWKVVVQKSVLGLIPAIWNSGDKSAWPLAASVTGVYMYFSVGCWTEDVFVMDPKILCGFSSI